MPVSFCCLSLDWLSLSQIDKNTDFLSISVPQGYPHLRGPQGGVADKMTVGEKNPASPGMFFPQTGNVDKTFATDCIVNVHPL